MVLILLLFRSRRHFRPHSLSFWRQSSAKEENTKVLSKYKGIEFHLQHYGGNGYQFLLNSGPFGASWAFKKPHPKDTWAVRVSVGSQFLALSGLGRAKAYIDETLAVWGFRFGPQDVSFARVDACVDVFAPAFTLNPDHFVMHGGTGRRDYIAGDKSVNGKSGRTTSVTLGKLSNHQVIIYDKRAEVIAGKKTYWWAIWNDTLRKQGLPLLHYVTLRRGAERADDPVTLRYVGEEPAFIDATIPDISRVWRIELRAGKDCLKDKWGIRTWEDLFARYGDLIRHLGEIVRYTEPNSDDNRSRWPNHIIWETVMAELNDDLLEMRSGADPNPMKEIHREEHIGLIVRQAFGQMTTLAALRSVKHEEFNDFLGVVIGDMKDMAHAEPEQTAKKLQDAKDRYRFL